MIMIIIIIMYAPWEPKIVSPRPTKGDSHRPPNFVLDFSSFHTLSSDSSTSAIRFHVAPYFVPSKLVQLLKLLNVILYHPCCWHFGDLDPKQMSNFHLSKHSKQNCWCAMSVSSGKANPYNCAIWLVDGAGEAFSGLVASCNSCAKPGQGRLMAEVWE